MKRKLTTAGAAWRRPINKSLFYMTASAVLISGLSCGSQEESSADYFEEIKVTEPTRGVITIVQETEPGKYEIVEETTVDDKARSRFIIRRLSGEEEVMGTEEASLLVNEADKDSAQVHQNHIRTGRSSLGSILWWSGMGYMMGRNMSSSPYNGFYRSGVTGAGQHLRQTSITRSVNRPVSSGRSGFFKSSSHSSHSG